MWLELKDDLQLPAAYCPAEQLITVTILFVPTNLKVGKETLDGFFEGHSMFSKFVRLEVILEIRRSEPVPIDHVSFYRGTHLFTI